MRRREFITLLGGAAAAWPLAARAQQPERMRRVAVFVGSATEDDPEAKLHATTLQTGLRKLGWIEGRDVRFDYRYSGGNPDIMAAHVAELVNLTPDVIVVQGNRPTTLL